MSWLFNFHANFLRPNVNKNQNSVLKHGKSTLLEKTCDLIRNFPEYLDVVVSVARKTDGRHWADLFSAAGRSTEYVFETSMLFILISTMINMWNVLKSLKRWNHGEYIENTIFYNVDMTFVGRAIILCDNNFLSFQLLNFVLLTIYVSFFLAPEF